MNIENQEKEVPNNKQENNEPQLETHSVRSYDHDPIDYIEIHPAPQTHISIRKDEVCLNECENKPCTYICPTRVYYWEDEKIQILYKRCVECGACIWGCPYENINWNLPQSGYGVVYKY